MSAAASTERKQTVARGRAKPIKRFWVFKEDGTHYELPTREQAEGIKQTFERATIFEAENFAEASTQYRKFLNGVGRGLEKW